MKRCTACKQSKALTDFNKNRAKRDGLSDVCRECNKERSRQHCHKYRDHHVKQVNRRRDEIRVTIKRIIQETKSTYGCQVCRKEYDPIVLDFHHKNPAEKSFNLFEAARWGYAVSTVIAEINKCVVCCANCHRRVEAGVREVTDDMLCKIGDGSVGKALALGARNTGFDSLIPDLSEIRSRPMAKKKAAKKKESPPVSAAWADQWSGKAPPPGPVKLAIRYDESRYGGAAINPEDPWPDHEDEHTEFSLTSVRLYEENPDNKWSWHQEVVEVDFPVEVGSTVYVVVVRYTTGGTFGRTLGAWSILGVYPDAEKADAVVKSVYDDSYPGYKCWQGYFESLESCDSHDMVVLA